MPDRGYELTDSIADGEPSSRNGAEWAGWSLRDEGWTWDDDRAYGGWIAHLEKRIDRRWGNFSWLSSRALLDSANDQIAKVINDVVGPRRERWIAAQRTAIDAVEHEDFVMDKSGFKSFLILGDPGEADGSQYALIDPMLAIGSSSDFMVVLSDVIYPAGDVNDYVNGFYIPFRGYQRPIYAIPGNHDWYDGLNGFMRAFCGAEPLPPTEYRRSSFTAPERIARLLWRQASRPNRTRLLHQQGLRAVDADARGPVQPAPYFALDIRGVRLIAIDTGIGGTIDAEQGEWLARVCAAADLPKVLLTGKPIWVDGEYKPTPIEWEPGEVGAHGYETVDDLVRDPRNRFVAAIGGDTHNYQRFTVTVEDERRHQRRFDKEQAVGPTRRRIEYIVSGGAGAYTGATHTIKYVNRDGTEGPRDRARRRADVRRRGNYRKAKYEPPQTVHHVGEKQFRAYPTRGDSLAYYARWWGRRISTVCSVTVTAALGFLALLIAWEGAGNEIGGQDVWEVFVAAAVGLPVATIGLGLSAWLAHAIAPRGYRTISVLTVTPAAIAAAVVLMPEEGDWIWSVLGVTAAVIALPVVLALLAYYGLGSNTPGSGGRMPRHLAISLLYVTETVLVSGLWSAEGADRLLIAALAVLAVWALTIALARFGRPVGRWLSKRPFIAWVALGITAGAPVVAPIVVYWDDASAVRIAVVAMALVSFVLALVLNGTIVGSGGFRALFGGHLAAGRVDPNEAIKYVNSKFGSHEAGLNRALGSVSTRTRAIGDLLLRRDGRRGFVNTKIAEAGNADTPPMFKNFLRVDVTDDDELVITCFGVTGWRDHDGRDGRPIPVEDRVTIDLSVARGDTPATDGQVHINCE